MGGVYTDNQPDFSFLQPGETKTWSQFWYPIRKIGPAQKANVDAAVSLRVAARDGHASALRSPAGGRTRPSSSGRAGRPPANGSQTLSPDQPLVFETIVGARLTP